jgi:phosphatidylserine decarboxylase
MRCPIAADSLRFAAPLVALAALAAVLGWWPVVATLLLGLVTVLAFFRDPRRTPPAAARAIVAAADGRVTDVDDRWDGDDLLPPCPRVGIFLSILDVHINRAPLDGEVVATHHRPGKFLNAMRAESSELNESNLILLRRGDMTFGVKQIAGAIARRIVCAVRPGDLVNRGQRLGLIRFGSRTEHYLPTGSEILVRVGDRVRAGETIVALLPEATEGGH